MPNHIHWIVMIDGNIGGTRHGMSVNVGTMYTSSLPKKYHYFLQFRNYFFCIFAKKLKMSDELFRNKYRNDTARATWHDYNGGEYFITICTKKREHHFGEIFDGTMQLSALGEYAEQCIKQIPMHNLYAQVPLFVIMPNHIHWIVMIDGNIGGTRHGMSVNVGTM